MRVCDLENWPPQPSESFKDSYAAPHLEQAMIKKVVHVQTAWIIFECEFNDEHRDNRAYYFETKDEITLVKLKAILEENVGKSLFSIGEMEIPER